MAQIFKVALLSLGLTIGLSTAVLPVHAQNGNGSEWTQDEKAARLKALSEDVITLSRIPDIYAELRRAFADIYLPALKEAFKETGVPPDNQPELKMLYLQVRSLEAGLKAADEMDPALERYGDEIIGDVANLSSQQMTNEQIVILEEFVQSPAARKTFNAFYALTRTFTGFSKSEFDDYAQTSGWLADLQLGSEGHPGAEPNAAPPSPERLAKAEAIISDFIRISRFEDMVREIVRFTRDVVLKVSELSPDRRSEIEKALQNVEFFNVFIKSMATSVAPLKIASELNEEQLESLHQLVLSPFVSKYFSLLNEFVREATSFTVNDVAQMQEFSKEIEAASQDQSSAEQRKLQKKWKDLFENWHERLAGSLSPKTRSELEEVFAELRALEQEIDAAEGKQELERPAPRLPVAPQRDL